jgi:hypothetical protein
MNTPSGVKQFALSIADSEMAGLYVPDASGTIYISDDEHPVVASVTDKE